MVEWTNHGAATLPDRSRRALKPTPDKPVNTAPERAARLRSATEGFELLAAPISAY